MDDIDILFKNHSFNSRLLYKEMEKRGIVLSPIRKTKLVRTNYGNHIEILYDIYTNLLTYTKGVLIDDKYFAKKFLAACGFSVNPGKVFDRKTVKSALLYASGVGFPVVIKPTTGSHGDGVVMDINDKKELMLEIDNFLSHKRGAPYFLVERQFTANEYRVFITKNDFFAVVQRVGANITGNGVNTIKQLIKAENWRRMNPRNTCLCTIPIDSVTLGFLKKQGLFLSSIPNKGQKIYLRKNSNVSTGGNCYDVTNIVHSSYIKLAKNILRALNVPFIGIDLLCEDISAKPSNYAICELNSAPGLSLHMMPEKGTSRNSAGALVDIIFPETHV